MFESWSSRELLDSELDFVLAIVDKLDDFKEGNVLLDDLADSVRSGFSPHFEEWEVYKKQLNINYERLKKFAKKDHFTGIENDPVATKCISQKGRCPKLFSASYPVEIVNLVSDMEDESARVGKINRYKYPDDSYIKEIFVKNIFVCYDFCDGENHLFFFTDESLEGFKHMCKSDRRIRPRVQSAHFGI